MSLELNKPEAILEAIRKSEKGDNIIIHNKEGLVWKILQVICIEHKEE